MALPKDPAKPTAQPELIECRVVGSNYGRSLKGDVLRVPQREIDRVTTRDRNGAIVHRVLISLEDEKKQIVAGQQPTTTRDIADANRRKQAAMGENERVRVAMIDKERLERAKRVVEVGGIDTE